MSNREDLHMVHLDSDAGQQDSQYTINQGTPDEEQPSSPEEERPEGQSHDNQSALFEEESEQEMLGKEESAVQLPEAGGPLPDGRGELVDLTLENVDQEVPEPLPADQPEKAVVPVTLEGSMVTSEDPI